MTKSQIDFILNKLNVDADTWTTLPNVYTIIVMKREFMYSDETKYRYYFDDTNELVKKVMVRKYWEGSTDEVSSHIPTGFLYDTIATSDTTTAIYAYCKDQSGYMYYDTFSYASITFINILNEVDIYD